jgi:hypothetical protein
MIRAVLRSIEPMNASINAAREPTMSGQRRVLKAILHVKPGDAGT